MGNLREGKTKKINKTKRELILLKILKGLAVGLGVLVVLISLSGCNTTTDNFELWAQPICLNEKEKEVISNENIDYFLLHNEMLGLEKCK